MPSQEEFLASLLESSVAVCTENVLAHVARVLRERTGQEVYNHAQLVHAEPHEAAIVQQQQRPRLRLTRNLPSIPELHELSEIAEPDALKEADDESNEYSDCDELMFSKEEVARCTTLAHARSGRDSAIELDDEEEPSYIFALAAILDAAPVKEVRLRYQHNVPSSRRDGQEEHMNADAADLETEHSSGAANASEVDRPSSVSTESQSTRGSATESLRRRQRHMRHRDSRHRKRW